VWEQGVASALIIISSKAVAVSFGNMIRTGSFVVYLLFLVVTVLILAFPYLALDSESERSLGTVRVMTYSSFLQEFGVGPELARRFKEATGLEVRWINAGNAGLLIERLKFKREIDRPDIVIGFDQFAIDEARRTFDWLEMKEQQTPAPHNTLPAGAQFYDFLAYDWGPLTFVYKEGFITPPTRLDDLLAETYRNKILLQDPRMSSPGLQFLLWVLAQKGEDEGFSFLEKLKPNIRMMAPSWSSSYSIFKREQPTLVFSYFTSPLFHQIEENDSSFRAVALQDPHPIQVEYAGIPRFCVNCEGARQLAAFLMKPDIQKLIMERNYMFPVDQRALANSAFKIPQNIRYYRPIESMSLTKKKRELVNLWKKVFY
jgi:thiamine transport system substrate-binding protein